MDEVLSLVLSASSTDIVGILLAAKSARFWACGLSSKSSTVMEGERGRLLHLDREKMKMLTQGKNDPTFRLILLCMLDKL